MRHRPRTFPYQRLLPYKTEDATASEQHLDHIIDNLFIALKGGDLSGVFGNSCGQLFVHWTRELSSWLKLKFDISLDRRLKLIRLYFDICLQATDVASIDRYTGILGQLSGDMSFNDWLEKNHIHLGLDWDRYYLTMVKMIPSNFNKTCFQGLVSKTLPLLTGMAFKLQVMPPDCDFDKYWIDLLSRINGPMDYLEDTTVSMLLIVVGQIPTSQAWRYRQIMPTIFHLWSLVPQTSLFEVQILYCLAILANCAITVEKVEIGEYGIFTEAEMRRIFASIHRLLLAEKTKIFEHGQMAFTPWIIVSSLSRDKSTGVMDLFETLIKSIEPFCHPSSSRNTGHVLSFLSDCVDMFTIRYTMEQANEGGFLPGRGLTDDMCVKFANIMLEPLLYGMYSKSRSTVATTLPSIYKLAYICPDIVIPRLLRDIYPSLQGFYTPHRTLSCLSALAAITPILVKYPHYAFHITSLLELVMPCIDANDPIKAFLAIKFVQTAALCVPFWTIGTSNELAMEHVSAIVNGMELPNFIYPTYTEQEAIQVLESSTMNFENIASTLLDQAFLLLENMPEKPNEIKNSPEYNLSFYLPYALGCVFNSVSPTLLDKLANKTLEFITNNHLNNAVDAMAHICGRLVAASPATIFPKLFPILDANIRYEVSENSAGISRSFALRDRNFIWYLSMLNMSLSSANAEILPFKDKIVDLTLFLRENTKGQSVYHVTNTIHHTIASLVSTSCNDCGTIEPGVQATWKHWGQNIDLKTLELQWHVPTIEEVEFAIDLYTKHVNLSIESIDAMISRREQAVSPTEFSDVLSSNLTYLRTSTSAVALLLNPAFECPNGQGSSSEYPSDEDDEEPQDHDDDFPSFELTGADEDEDIDIGAMLQYRKYNVNAFSLDENDPLYQHIHNIRKVVGERLLGLLRFLLRNHESDTQALKGVLFAIKVWFSDVGVEKSAKLDHYQKSVYISESRTFKIKGLRKTLFPRPTLARRAMMYHLQRLNHNTGVRDMSKLDRALLLELVNSTLSIYPDIRRHAQSSLYSTIKVLAKSRSVVYPRILQSVASAIASGDYKLAESGLLFLNYRSMSSVVKRRYKNVAFFFQLIFMAIRADNQQLNLAAFALAQRVAEDIKLPVSIKVETCVSHDLPIEAQEKIAALTLSTAQRRAVAENQVQQLIDLVNAGDFGGHWRSQAMALLILNATLPCPQVQPSSTSLSMLSREVLSANPVIKRLSQDTLTVALYRLFLKAQCDYNFNIYRLDFDDRSLEGDNITVTSAEFFEEMQNTDSPNWFYDSKFINPALFVFSRNNRGGWLKWPPSQGMSPAGSAVQLPFKSSDVEELQEWGSSLDKEWFGAYVARCVVEPKEEENHFQIMNAMVLRFVFVLVDQGYTSLTFEEIKAFLMENANFNDLDWQRALSEVMFALVNGMSVFKPHTRSKCIEIAHSINDCVLSGSFSNDSLSHWSSSLRYSHINIDHRRVWPLTKPLQELNIDDNSGTKESFKLALRTDIIKLHAWRYRIDIDTLVANLCDNFGHPLESIRTEVAKQLAVILQTRPHHCVEDMQQLDVTAGISGDQQAREYAQLVNNVFDRIIPTGGKNFVDKARAFCLFVENLISTPFFSIIATALIDRAIPTLLQFSNVRDDTELVKSTTNVFSLISARNFPDCALPRFVEAFDSWLSRSTWHQKVRVLLLLQEFYGNNLFRFDDEQRESLLRTICAALDDAQVEVRELAATILVRWILCESPATRTGLVTRLNNQFSQRLEVKNPTIIRHGGALGLGALVGAFPYETPLPVWIPETLSILARYAGGGSVIAKTVKRTFSDFKRSRQDTWHLDQKMFSQDQLDSLEGVLFRNYFV